VFGIVAERQPCNASAGRAAATARPNLMDISSVLETSIESGPPTKRQTAEPPSPTPSEIHADFQAIKNYVGEDAHDAFDDSSLGELVPIFLAFFSHVFLPSCLKHVSSTMQTFFAFVRELRGRNHHGPEHCPR